MKFHGKPKGKALPVPLRRKLEGYVQEHGEVEAARLLGITRQTIFRAIAGRPVHRGTASVIETALDGSAERKGVAQ